MCHSRQLSTTATECFQHASETSTPPGSSCSSLIARMGSFRRSMIAGRRTLRHFVIRFAPSSSHRDFSSRQEMEHDRRYHLAAVRRMFEELDVLVFTLGLTETWRSLEDGLIYPICPGCGAGTYDPAKHEFVNFGVDDSDKRSERVSRQTTHGQCTCQHHPDRFTCSINCNDGRAQCVGFYDLLKVRASSGCRDDSPSAEKRHVLSLLRDHYRPACSWSVLP